MTAQTKIFHYHVFGNNKSYGNTVSPSTLGWHGDSIEDMYEYAISHFRMMHGRSEIRYMNIREEGQQVRRYGLVSSIK